MKKTRGIDPGRLGHLMDTIEEKKRIEIEEVEAKRREEERKILEEQERKRTEEDEIRKRRLNYCAWHENIRAEYVCDECKKRFCTRCLGETKEDNTVYCKSCWSSLKYKTLLREKPKVEVKEQKVNNEVMVILESLEEENIEELTRTIRRLGAEKAPEVVNALIDKLNHRDERIRIEAAKSLGKIGSPKAVLPLCNLLGDSNDNVRKTAIISLEFLNDERAIEHLKQLSFMEQDEAIKDLIKNTCNSLNRIREEKAFKLIRELNTDDIDKKAKIMDELVSMGDGAINPVIKVLSGKNTPVIIACLEIIAAVGEKSAVDSILPLLRYPDNGVKVIAIETLGRLKDKRALEYLLELQDDENPKIRMALLEAVSFIPSTDAINLLLNSLLEENEEIRRKTINVLDTIELPEVAGALVNFLVQEKSSRKTAAEILEKRGKDALEELQQSLQEAEEEDLQKYILEILGITGDKNSIDEIGKFSKKKGLSKEIKGLAKDMSGKISKRLGLGIGETFSRFIRNLNKACMNLQFKSKKPKEVKQRTVRTQEEVLPICSVCNKPIRKQYPEMKGNYVWELINRNMCKKCNKLFCPKCAKQSEMGMGTILISCPNCKK